MKTLLVLALVISASLAVQAGEIREADRRKVVEAVAMRLQEGYVFPEKGAAMAEALRSKLKRQEYDRFTDGDKLAMQLSDDLQRVSGDRHLNVEYTEKPVADESAVKDPDFEAKERERYYGAHLNFGFNAARLLEGNIGLLELNVFAPVDMGGDTAVNAMQFLAHTQALIVDLRGNGGGDGDMAKLLMSYLFDGGSKPISGFYSRPKDQLTQESTLAYVPGRRYGERKPVYVLTSRKTFSAAEAFAYDLQALKRVTLVGEPTGGGAHPFDYERVHPNFVLWLVTGRSLNPITGSNWQGVGVQPDVAVPADQALERALALARGAGQTRESLRGRSRHSLYGKTGLILR